MKKHTNLVQSKKKIDASEVIDEFELDEEPMHSTLMVNLIKLLWTRKKLLQHESLTPIKSGITSSQIL